ncbi:hypothetical protein GT347_03320 [Xylophilus rhododendri]|uniref:Uncharacterized protein n=1 Tax=Xylophilus rhododendri TaxID=2697032 RepID=A0A857J1S2_9BURK|nr:ATP/GTP-binding protein [Xylophilus rhododendri]QHI97099.1 hypothetical protein GT347_03320 [Xylophilus rhododendri]
MFHVFHASGVTFFACAVACKTGWLPVVDIVTNRSDITRHQRLEVYPTQIAALLASFADASYLASLVRQHG